MKRFVCILTVFLAASFCAAKQEQKPSIFKANDNICLVGDSITHGGFYTENLLLYYATRFPDIPLSFYNLGISGDSCWGIISRFDDDIDPVKANVYTLMIGMNDVGRGKFSDSERTKPDHQKKVLQTRESYEKNLDKIAAHLSGRSRKLIMFTPSIYDQTSENKTENLKGVNDELKVFGQIGRKLAEKYDAKVVDMWSYMETANERLHKTDKTKSVIGADRVHPQDVGGFVMASKFIIDLGEPKFVSRMAFDAKAAKLSEAFNADVSDVKFGPEGLSFTALEAALPYPTGADKDGVDAVLGFLPEYNKQMFSVKNLKPGKYELSIDGKNIGQYTSEELSEGINLAMNKNTPQYKQAQEVAKLCRQFRLKASEYRGIRATEFFAKLRKYKTDEERIEAAKRALTEGKEKNPYVLGLIKRYPDLKPKQGEMGRAVQAIVKDVYAAAKTKPHQFNLRAVK